MKKTFALGVVALGISFSALGLDFLPDVPPIPADNPQSEAKVKLGKQLYFDPRISKTGKVSCNSCHNVNKGGDDNLSVSVGVDGKKGNRSAPTVWNSAFYSVQFWDGRAATLEEQAKGPMINPVEMAMPNHEAVVAKLASISGYRKQFDEVFGKNSLNIDNVAKAIASYERTLISPNSPYDRFARGDEKALSPAAKRGFQLVQTVGCVSCHNGPNFAGPVMPVGQGFFMKFPTFSGSEYDQKYKLTADLGRFEATKKEADKHLWRVPTWRNIALTAPYFHNGSVKTLDEAVRVMAKTQLNRTLKNDEVKDIVEFLKSLTGERARQTSPQLPKM
jgi:cytochrome c peroxidase